MNSKSHTDYTDELLSRARHSDSHALEMLYKQHHERLLAIACRYIPDVEMARDVEHDAWVMILTSLDSLHDSSKLTSWMGSIVRNMALNFLKQSHNNQHVPLEQAEHAITETTADDPQPISLPLIQAMVQRLPQGYEQVFRLNTFEGLSHREIGERLGITASSSRSQLTRARKMLQEMIKQHWALLAAAIALLLPMGMLLLQKRGNENLPQPQRRVADSQQPAPVPEAPLNITASGNSSYVHSSIDAIAGDTSNDLPPVRVAGDTASVFNGLGISATHISHPGIDVAALPEVQIVVRPVNSIKATRLPKQDKLSNRLKLHLAYGGGAPVTGSTVTDNFLSVINFAGGETQRAMRLYTWKDYREYVNDNATLMDTTDARAMTQIAKEHKESKDETPLSETKHHDRPRSVQLSLTKPLSHRWSMTSGVGFMWMKSTFETDFGNGNHNMRRTQRLYYLNVPLGATYTIWQRRRWAVYASGSVRLDIPLRGRETTRYIYTGTVPHAPGDSLVFPTTHAPVKAPWQWSVGAGVGVQYQLLPHVNLYFEPGFRYYISTGSPVETYRTEHPFDVALPFGIRFTP